MYIIRILIVIIFIYFGMENIMKKIITLFRNMGFKVKKNKKIVFLMIGAMMGAFFAGCDTEEMEDPLEITLVSGWGGTFESHKEMRAIYEEFDRQNPDIQLNYISYSDNAVAVEHAIDMLAVGAQPDIVSTNGFSRYLEYAVMTDEAMDLMPYIEADESWKQQIHPAVFDIWKTEEGQLYTLPDALEIAGYWYNEEYLRQAGVIDQAGNVVLPKTWEEFENMIFMIQRWLDENRMKIPVFRLEQDQLMGSYFLARLAGENEEGLSAVYSENPKLSEELLETVAASIEELKTYSMEADNIEDARQKFLEGKSVIYFGGVWESEEFIKSPYKDVIGYANYPTYNKLSLGYLSASSGYVIAKQQNERKAEACIRFLKYITSEEVQKKIVLTTSQAPVNTSISREKIKDANSLFGESLDIAYSADIHIPTIHSVWKESQIDAIHSWMK